MVLEQVVDYYLKFGKSTYDRKLKNYSLNFKLCNNSWTLLKEGFSYNCFYYIPERKIFGEIKKKQGMKSSLCLSPTFTFFQIYYRTV